MDDYREVGLPVLSIGITTAERREEEERERPKQDV